MPRPTVSSRTKTIRRRMSCGYTMPPDEDLIVHATYGTYLRKGEHFVIGSHIYETVSRTRGVEYDRWNFACRTVRALTKSELAGEWPPEVPGTAWGKS